MPPDSSQAHVSDNIHAFVDILQLQKDWQGDN